MVVRMRSTKSHTGNRRSHHALSSVNFFACENCKAKKMSHAVCVTCGFYRGRKVLDLVKKAEKKQKKAKAKETQSR
ncbi:50S ribosomal protein L32 [Candidatus Nomurabacteria bacterium RIFCSPLOWO2_02_FULL_41_9]|nr:MAG: 50S ribosomal protein L32 [Candidatus Nomurabacteria bacterium RIFCSPLOWO2_02_FULL_41_9]